MVNVDLSQLSQGEYQLYLVDLNGKVVYHQTTTQKSIQLDMRNYSTGSYVLKVQTKGTQQIDTFQIIKTNKLNMKNILTSIINSIHFNKC